MDHVSKELEKETETTVTSKKATTLTDKAISDTNANANTNTDEKTGTIIFSKLVEATEEELLRIKKQEL